MIELFNPYLLIEAINEIGFILMIMIGIGIWEMLS